MKANKRLITKDESKQTHEKRASSRLPKRSFKLAISVHLPTHSCAELHALPRDDRPEIRKP